ncbi:hypothetical protein AB0K48_56245, partial [Nonomuraea sp. NPDC055795]
MPPVIEVRNLHKRYADKVAVDDVSLTIQEGEGHGLGQAMHARREEFVDLVVRESGFPRPLAEA